MPVPSPSNQPNPLIMPLGDEGLLVRFAQTLDDCANRRAIAFARRLHDEPIPGVCEVVPNLVSVLLRYQPESITFQKLAGEVRLRLLAVDETDSQAGRHWDLPARFDGPDLAEVAGLLELDVATFLKAHAKTNLRVLAVGFAPGFLYCGMHPANLVVPRRKALRSRVPAGTILFAAGQTAITATEVPTGWHVIGHTDFANFDPLANPPVRIVAGDHIRFVSVR
ncbi:MAG: allophanate hydrolase subunit 1 [Hyphomicrobiaceae bacterium]|nr:allophanate hydrolase subunit 1 [Hyphomicrobiaceae bacterium]